MRLPLSSELRPLHRGNLHACVKVKERATLPLPIKLEVDLVLARAASCRLPLGVPAFLCVWLFAADQ